MRNWTKIFIFAGILALVLAIAGVWVTLKSPAVADDSPADSHGLVSASLGL